MNTPSPDLPPMSVKAIYIAFWQNRTKILGYLGAAAAAIVAAPAGDFPASLVRIATYLTFAFAVSTAAVGHLNSARLKRLAAASAEDEPAAPLSENDVPEAPPGEPQKPVVRRSTFPRDPQSPPRSNR